jgi:cytoskeletal protein CcmA (bactofilin family)
VIGQSTRVRGRVSGEGDLRVEGTLEGDVSIRGDLTIGSGARAVSAIEAHAVVVAGELEGDIRAQSTVQLEAGARVRGDVHGESIAIDEGAELSGRLLMEFELPAELGGSGGGKRR